MTHLLARAERGQHDKPMRLESRAVGQCWHLHWHRPGHRLWEIRLGVFVQLQHFNAVKHRSDRRRQRRRRRRRRTQSTSGTRCVRWGPVLLEDTVSTALHGSQYERSMSWQRAALIFVSGWMKYGGNTWATPSRPMRNDRGALLLARFGNVQQHRGEECPTGIVS